MTEPASAGGSPATDPQPTATTKPATEPAVATEPPVVEPPRATNRASSLVLVATGDGKGKTTAAMGTALRAIARGWAVCVVQFIKSGKWQSGEAKILSSLGVDWHTMGDGFTWDSEDLEHSAEMARAAWDLAKEKIASGQYRLVILDEVTYPVNWDWIPGDEVTACIAGRPEGVNVFCTGRDAPAALVDLADTVSDVRKVKHAYEAGVMAVKGIDF
jgi:cob(I)alamin adenosyltransferase